MVVTSVILSKSQARELALDYLSKVTNEDKANASKTIIKKLVSNEVFINSKYVGLYYPLKNEINLRVLIEMFPNKIFSYPKVIKDNLIFLEVNENTIYKTNKYNIKEPVSGSDITNKLEVCLVPALGRNKNNYRLGFGKGYYDKFFKERLEIYKIGITFSSNLFDFKVESHDIPLNIFICN